MNTFPNEVTFHLISWQWKSIALRIVIMLISKVFLFRECFLKKFNCIQTGKIIPSFYETVTFEVTR